MEIKNQGFIVINDPGLIALVGESRFDFLQRQTTNDIDLLEHESVLISVLTNPEGRILDVFHLFNSEIELDGESNAKPAVFVLPLPGRAGKSIEFLQQRIFFMDQVEIKDLSPKYSQIEIFGTRDLEKLFNPVESESELSGLLSEKIENIKIRAIQLRVGMEFRYRLIIKLRDLDRVISLLLQENLNRLSPGEYEANRINHGIPGVETEYNSRFTPLEIGLRDAISTSKGCYTGQEVLARQINFDKITRRLTGIRSKAKMTAGSKLYSGNKPSGDITSVVKLSNESWIGLGVLKKPFDEPGNNLAANPESEVLVEVVDFPIIESNPS